MEAHRGNGYACYDLGRIYLLGLDSEADEEEAQRWFRGMPWKRFTRQNIGLRSLDTCDTASGSATPMATVRRRTMKNPPAGSGRRWKRTAPLPPILWQVNTSGDRGWSRTMGKPTACISRQLPTRSSPMPTPSTSSEECAGRGSGRKQTRRHPDSGMQELIRDFWPWRKPWQMTGCTTAWVP